MRGRMGEMMGASKRVALGEGLFVRVCDVAALLDVSEGTVEKMCREGQIKAIKVRTQWRIFREEFLRDMGLDGRGLL